MINVSGHRIGTAEVEGALTQHPQCAEAAVVPVEHPIKGQGIYAYVTLMVVRTRAAPRRPLHSLPTAMPQPVHDKWALQPGQEGLCPCRPHDGEHGVAWLCSEGRSVATSGFHSSVVHHAWQHTGRLGKGAHAA